ncbi:MAG: outer membrane protein [Cryomorphaceae bacterium]|jgi:outer membrane protein
MQNHSNKMQKSLFRTLAISFLLFLLCAVHSTAFAKQSFSIALVSDLGLDVADDITQLYLEELIALTGDEFDLQFIDYQIDWSEQDVAHQFDRIYQNPKVDMVLVEGLAANQVAAQRKTFPKPTFLPLVIERDSINVPYKDGVSGKKNLSYLSYSTQLFDTLEQLQEVVQFSNVAILTDEILLRVLPTALIGSTAISEEITLSVVSHDGQNHNLIDQLNKNVDAVMIGHLPRMSADQIDALIESLTARGLPTFSYLEEGLVERGLLATPISKSIYQFAARRNALNMQAVMLGRPASQQPVLVESKAKLTINQATAERLDIAINFKVLVDANVVGFGSNVTSERYDLFDIAALTLKRNLQLKDERYNLEIQSSERRIAKADLMPKFSASGSISQRKDDSSLVQSGFAAEDSTDIALNLSQTVYSDSQWANYKIQSLLFDASSSMFLQTELDVIREASLAMADILQAQAEAAIQQENLTFSEKNLELAVDRVSLGASTSADQYRWETQVANAKSALFDSFSRVFISKQNLNRILNIDIIKNFEVEELDMDALMIYTVAELFDLMDNTATFERAYEFGIAQAHLQSPEIARLNSIVAAKKKEIAALSRRNWFPEVSLTGQLSDNVDRSGLQADGDDGRDWQFMLNAQIPFYQGGQIKAQHKKSEIELAQLENQLALIKQQIALQLRTSMNNVLTSLFNLQFTNSAASAAARGLSLVTDAYSQGAVPVVDLLDAQTSSINANLAKVQAYIGFFRAYIEMQRTIGVYEFLLSPEEKKQVRALYRNAIEN